MTGPVQSYWLRRSAIVILFKPGALHVMSASPQISKQKEPIVNVMLNGGHVTLGFRVALFDAADRAGMSVNEFVLQATGEKLQAAGAQFSGIFRGGDVGSGSTFA